MEENKNNAIEKTESITENAKRREEQAEERRANSGSRRKGEDKVRNRLIAAVVTLGCTVLILGGLLTFNYFTPLDSQMGFSVKEQKNFYDLVSYVDNLDVNLSKLVVSNDESEQQKLLSEVRVQSSLATNSLAEMSLQDENKYNTTKFINQVGDFSKYLNDKLIEGEEITDKDKEILRKGEGKRRGEALRG